QPHCAPQPTLRWPSKIQTLVILSSFNGLRVVVLCLLQFVLTQRYISKTRTCSRAKTSGLTEVTDSSDRNSGGFASSIEIFLSPIQIIVREGNATHSELVTRVHDRGAVVIEFFFRLNRNCRQARRGPNVSVTTGKSAHDRAKATEPSGCFGCCALWL